MLHIIALWHVLPVLIEFDRCILVDIWGGWMKIGGESKIVIQKLADDNIKLQKAQIDKEQHICRMKEEKAHNYILESTY